MFRFMPIEQTNSLVVITPQPEYLKSAEDWLYRLDRGGAENATQLYVYNVKNLKAPDLADYLSQIFLGSSTGSSHRNTTGSVAPGLRPTTLGGRGGIGQQHNVGCVEHDDELSEFAAPAIRSREERAGQRRQARRRPRRDKATRKPTSASRRSRKTTS